jgi:hypothetical protein
MANPQPTARSVAEWAGALQSELKAVLARVESSPQRAITLTDSFDNLSRLTVKQDALLREALYCVEQGLYRPAHVAAWTAFIDYFHEWLVPRSSDDLLSARPKWKIVEAADLRLYGDYELIEAAKACGAIGKIFSKALQGLLNKRNECAHPEDYNPGLNDTLGYIDELFKRIANLQLRSLDT